MKCWMNNMTEEEKRLLRKAVAHINETVSEDIRIMEICGTHTHQIARFGIGKLLVPQIHLVSGPGCPVCVTEPGYIDVLIRLLARENVIIATFGDLLRVGGFSGTLERQRSAGKNVITVYSPEDAISLARNNQNSGIVLAAVGFETTAPLYAALVKAAQAEGIHNLYLATSVKRMEPAVRFILEDTKAAVDGMLCPGHVAAITGIGPFLPITEAYKIPAVICGFEAMDLIASIGILCGQITGRAPVRFRNLYRRCVCDAGNSTALNLISEVFEVSDARWRGIGVLKASALSLNSRFEAFDALKRFDLKIDSGPDADPAECECGKILVGEKTPDRCVHYGKRCTPQHPIGPCMISSEGACAAYFRYRGGLN